MNNLAVPVLVIAALVVSMITVGSVFSGDSGAPDHLLFYGAKANVKDQVVLDDQFADDKKFEVKGLRGLGVPTDKNPGSGYEPDHPNFHYTTYKIKRSKGEPKHEKVNKIVKDQFGTLQLEVRGPVAILVPAFKTLAAPAPVAPTLGELSANVVDHYTCYNIKSKHFSRVEVAVTDQFIDPLSLGVTKQVEVKKPQSLCAPTTKTHKGTSFPISNSSGEAGPHLMCYKIELLDDDNEQVEVWTGDQFIEQQIRVRTKKPEILCVPAEKSDPE